jgi:hypothetical protein
MMQIMSAVSFFKNSLAVNNLDKICGQHSSQVTRPEFELGKVVEAKANLDSEKSQVTQQGSEKLEKAKSPILPAVDRVKSCSRLRYLCLHACYWLRPYPLPSIMLH